MNYRFGHGSFAKKMLYESLFDIKKSYEKSKNKNVLIYLKTKSSSIRKTMQSKKFVLRRKMPDQNDVFYLRTRP